MNSKKVLMTLHFHEGNPMLQKKGPIEHNKRFQNVTTLVIPETAMVTPTYNTQYQPYECLQ